MATQVEFHTGVEDVTAFACRLLRKAYQKGARVLVTGPGERLARLDRELWTAVEREFLPHLRWASGAPVPAQAARTPIWLVDGDPPAGSPPVLVNLGAELSEDGSGFERVIEIVGADDSERLAARNRWRRYTARGLPVVHHAAGGGRG